MSRLNARILYWDMVRMDDYSQREYEMYVAIRNAVRRGYR